MRASSLGPSLKWWSERGVQSSAARCRVSVPMMPVRLRGDMLRERHVGIWNGLHPVWLERRRLDRMKRRVVSTL